MNKTDILIKIKDGTFPAWYSGQLDHSKLDQSNKFSLEIFGLLDELVSDGEIFPYRIMRHMGFIIPEPGTINLANFGE